MSKASAWGRTMTGLRTQMDAIYAQEGKRPEFSVPYGSGRLVAAQVDDAGALRVGNGNGRSLTNAEALALAQWLLDTFGEEEPRP